MRSPSLLPNNINVFFLKFYSLLSKVFVYLFSSIFWSLPFRLESFSKHLEILCFRSFIFLKKKLHILVLIFIWMCRALLSWAYGIFCHGAWAFHCSTEPHSSWAQELQHTGLVALWHMEPSQTGDQALVSCVGRGIIYQWTITEVLDFYLKIFMQTYASIYYLWWHKELYSSKI